jgi:hypothetical protein
MRDDTGDRSSGREPLKVYWQPGCTGCLRMKEFLTKHGVSIPVTCRMSRRPTAILRSSPVSSTLATRRGKFHNVYPPFTSAYCKLGGDPWLSVSGQRYEAATDRHEWRARLTLRREDRR